MSDNYSAQTKWNQKYRERESTSSMLAPTIFLKEQEPLLSALSKGPALDIACGNGRNAYYLANLGFDVDAIDISDVAIRWVAEEAMKRKAAVNPIQLDLTKSLFPRSQYQVIISFHYLQRSLFPLMIEALLPDGLLIFETMHRDYVDLLGHQMNREFLLDDNELLDAFRGLRVLRYEEGVKNVGSSGKQTATASLVALKV